MTKTDWFWEGNIIRAVNRHLESRGWTIVSIADTASREKGPDLVARRKDETLVVEAKGYPFKLYQRGVMKGAPKPTRPDTQARHWFAQVLLSALLRQSDDHTYRVTIALPEYGVYTNLLGRTREVLEKLGVTVLIVRPSGVVVALPAGRTL